MKKLIIDVSSGTRQEVDLTDEEIAEREASHLETLAQEQARKERKVSVIEKLGALGLTPDEVADVFGLEVEK